MKVSPLQTRQAERQGVILVALTCGWMTLPNSLFVDGEPGQITVPATPYLIDRPDGLAVFDTGLGPRFARAVGSAVQGPVDLEVGAHIGVKLRDIGVNPKDIRWIINSHLRTDHAGGDVILAADCCNLRRSPDEMRLPDHFYNAEQYRMTLQALKKLQQNGARIFMATTRNSGQRCHKGSR